MKTFLLIFLPLSFSLISCKAIDKLEDDIKNSFINYAEPPTETYSSVDEPPRLLPKNPAGCPDWKKNTANLITKSMKLPLGCKYDRVKLLINKQSNLILDCNGAIFNGLDKEFRQKPGTTYLKGREPLDMGILVASNESYQSHNITIKNCTFNNFVRGFRVGISLSKESLYDLRNNINVEALENHLRSVSPSNIHLENSNINFSHKDGVYIGRFVNGFVLDGSSINSTGVVGVYLDSGSINNVIKNSHFSKNGFSRYVDSQRKITKEYEEYSREAIAIDSSSQNRIEGNTFEGNSHGSIFIYKNCNEFHTKPRLIPRYQSADNNIITKNKFKNERVGVWIASRQSADLKYFECGTPRIATDKKHYGPETREIFIYEDFAKNNQVLNNTFENIRTSIIIEDDNSIANGNIFKGKSNIDIKVGTKYRTEKLSHPVKNTTIKNNTFNSSSTTKIKLIYSPVNTIISGNKPSELNK